MYQLLKPTGHHRVKLDLSLLLASLSSGTVLLAAKLTSKAETVTGTPPQVTAASRVLTVAAAVVVVVVVVAVVAVVS